MRTRMPWLIRCPNPRRFLPSSTLVTVALLSVLAVTVWASVGPTVVFQLDGNATVDNTATLTCLDNGGNPLSPLPVGCDDWDLLNGNGSGGSAGNSSVRTFIAGPSSPETFATGGSKDPLDITNWRWTTGSVPAKDNLTNGYAAAYDASFTNNELILEFGADRLAQNGDSNIGIWFFQQQVAPQPNGTFSGMHVNNDVFIVSAFTGGGGISTITAYVWDNTCTKAVGTTVGQCADSNLRVLFNSATVCGSADACALVNPSPISVTWPYTPKSGPSGTVPTGGFYEGGLNLTQQFAALGVTTLPCFTTFLEETRSSQSTSAVLKDFIGGSFPLCGLTVSKACTQCNVVQNGTVLEYTASGQVCNVGVGPLFNVVVTDTPQTPAAPVTINIGQLNAPSSTFNGCDNWGPILIDYSGPNAPNPATDQASALGFTAQSGGNEIDAKPTGLKTCPVCVLNPNLMVTKTCSTNIQTMGTNPAFVVVRSDYNGTVQNTGNVKLTNVFVTDSPDGQTFNLPDLLPGATECYPDPTSCAAVASFFPSTFTPVSPGRATFSDAVTASGKSALPPNTVQTAGPIQATCPLCPPGSAACPAP